MQQVDIAIVGAGPAGLYAAYYAGFRGASVALIDSLEQPGGQIAALYPEKAILDVAGFPDIRGQDLVDRLVEQAERSEPTWLLGHRAEELASEDDHVVLRTDRGEQVHAGAVLITGGIGTFSPRPLPVGAEFEGRGLYYFVPKLDALAGRDVLIVGGGDSAFDWAMALEDIARSVVLIHRRDRFRAHEHTVETVLNSSVEVLTHTEVTAVHGDEHSGADEGAITSVMVTNSETGEERELKVNAVVAALGFKADLGPLKRWGIEHQQRKIIVDTTMATTLPRIFAAGDITAYPGKVDLISVGFGEAAIAVNNAMPVINPDARVFPGHSTNA